MNNKRRFILVLAILAIALTACGQKDWETNDSTRSAAINEGDISPDTNGNPIPEQDSRANEIENPQNNVNDSITDAIGHIAGAQYVNSYFSFGFAPNQDWSFSTEDEVLAANGLSSSLSREERESQIKEICDAGNYYVAVRASSPGGTEMIDVQITHMDDDIKGLSDYDLCEMLSSDTMKSVILSSSSAITDVNMLHHTIPFLSSNKDSVFMEAVMSAYGSQVSVFSETLMLKGDTYIAKIQISATDSNRISTILGYFHTAD